MEVNLVFLALKCICQIHCDSLGIKDPTNAFTSFQFETS